MKYVIFEYKDGQRAPVLFGTHTVHAAVKLDGATPISAGEFSISRLGVKTFGESLSLDLKPRKSDARLISFALTNADALMVMANLKFVEKKRQKRQGQQARADVKAVVAECQGPAPQPVIPQPDDQICGACSKAYPAGTRVSAASGTIYPCACGGTIFLSRANYEVECGALQAEGAQA